MRTLKPLSEDQLVASIEQTVGQLPRKLVVGIGDDAAVWKAPRSHLSVVTTDMLVDGVHFRCASTTPRSLGHKALAVNLSDIAAMGAAPAIATVALGVTDRVDETWAREFYAGMAELARRSSCAIAGGDIARAPELTIAVTVVGSVRRSGLRLRSGAKAGDVACVSGALGLAAAGLQVCDEAMGAGASQDNGSSGRLSSQHAATLRAAYETPVPRLAEGAFLGASRATHAMMDVSDGLSLDGSRMARASGVDLCLDLTKYRVHPALAAFAAVYTSAGAPQSDAGHAHQTAAELILHGGDDYELLVAVEPRAFENLAKRFRGRFKRELEPVGRFEAGDGKVWTIDGGIRREHAPRGYDHLLR